MARPSVLTEAQKDRLQASYMIGVPIAMLAKTFNISVQYVYKLVKGLTPPEPVEDLSAIGGDTEEPCWICGASPMKGDIFCSDEHSVDWFLKHSLIVVAGPKNSPPVYIFQIAAQTMHRFRKPTNLVDRRFERQVRDGMNLIADGTLKQIKGLKHPVPDWLLTKEDEADLIAE